MGVSTDYVSVQLAEVNIKTTQRTECKYVKQKHVTFSNTQKVSAYMKRHFNLKKSLIPEGPGSMTY